MVKFDEYHPFNSVMYNGKAVTIMSKEESGYYLSNKIICNSDELSPIPLSKESVRQDDSTFFHFSSGLLHIIVGNVELTVDTSNGVCIVENKRDKAEGEIYKDIFYLHQLQNLIYKHTGVKFFLQSNNQQ